MNVTQAKQLQQSREARELQQPPDLEHWLEIGKRIDDPTTAELVVSFLDQHPTVKARFGGLYLRGQDVLQQRRLALAKDVADQLEREYAAKRHAVQKIGRTAWKGISLAYRFGRLVFRGVRDLLFMIQDMGTVKPGHVAGKRILPRGERS